MRRRVVTRVETADGGVGSSVVCYLLRAGASLTTGGATSVSANSTATVRVKHPGALRLNDTVYWLSNGTTSGSFQVNSAPTFNSGGYWEVVLLDLSGSTTAIGTTGDLVLKWDDTDHYVTWYDSDVAGTGTSGVISPSSTTGQLTFYVEAADLDIAIVQGGTLAAYVRDIPVDLREYVTPEEFGAVGDNSTDDTKAIQNAIDYAAYHSQAVKLRRTTYKISDTIHINCDFYGTGATLACTSAVTRAVLIALENAADPARMYFKTIYMPQIDKTKVGGDATGVWTGSDIGVEIRHLYNSRVFFTGEIGEFETGILIKSVSTGTALNEFHMGRLINNKIGLHLWTVAGTTGWVNENNFYGGDYVISTDEGTNIADTYLVKIDTEITASQINGNTFYKPVLEGTAQYYALWVRGQYNTIFAPRCETSGGADWRATFNGGSTRYNMIISGTLTDRAIGSTAEYIFEETADGAGTAEMNAVITGPSLVMAGYDLTYPPFRFKHAKSDTIPAIAVYDTNALHYAGGDDWALAMGGFGFDIKEYTNDYARLRIDKQGRIYRNTGSAAVTAGQTLQWGSGSPESSITAPVGSMYLRTGGAVGTTLYVKETGTGNTGWTAMRRPTSYVAGGTTTSPTTYTAIATYTIAQNGAAAGQAFRVKAFGIWQGTNGVKDARLVLGSSVLQALTQTAAPNQYEWMFDATIVFNAVDSQKSSIITYLNNAVDTLDIYESSAEDISAGALDIKIEAQLASASDSVILGGFVVEFVGGA